MSTQLAADAADLAALVTQVFQDEYRRWILKGVTRSSGALQAFRLDDPRNTQGTGTAHELPTDRTQAIELFSNLRENASGEAVIAALRTRGVILASGQEAMGTGS